MITSCFDGDTFFPELGDNQDSWNVVQHQRVVPDDANAHGYHHIVLDRAIAERGRYPAVNVLKSLSRAMPQCNTDEEQAIVLEARGQLAVYEDMAELIRLGAYRNGTNPEVDCAMRLYPQLEAYLTQRKEECSSLESGYAALSKILESVPAKGSAR